MIDVRNLVKDYGSFRAIDGISFHLGEGVIGLVGPNGAGKSTLFRCIADVLRLTDGEIKIDGIPHSDLEAKKEVFFLSDDPYVERNASMKDMLRFNEVFYDIDETKFFGLIHRFGLPEDRRLSSFSKGMRRQAFLALALSTKCKYLLLDEAFDGLDPLIIENLKGDLLKEKEAGRCIVISTHNIAQLERLVDTFIILTNGKLASGENAKTFIKYQAWFKKPVNEEELLEAGLPVIHLQTYGSITHIALREEEGVEEKLKLFPAYLLERTPIGADELITLRMMEAKKGEDK